MSAQELDHRRLDKAMTARVKELGLKWTALARHARVSTQTIRNLRNGTHLPAKETRDLIEDILLWTEGDILVELRGGTATPLPAKGAVRGPLSLPAPQPEANPPAPAHGFGADLESLGLDPQDPDVQMILSLKHLGRRAKLRWLVKLADVVAEEENEAPPRKDESPQQGSN